MGTLIVLEAVKAISGSDGNLLLVVHCKVDLLPGLQVHHVKADQAVETGCGNDLLEQDLEIFNGRSGGGAANEGKRNGTVGR
jgi:hypothetical protein